MAGNDFIDDNKICHDAVIMQFFVSCLHNFEF